MTSTSSPEPLSPMYAQRDPPIISKLLVLAVHVFL
jgi:hypothetical protein